MAWKQDFCGSENNNYFYLSPFLAEWAAIKHLQKKSLLAAQRHLFCLQGSPFILCPSWAAWSSVAAPEMAKNLRSPIPQLQRGLCRANTTGGEWELVWLSPAKPLTLCRVLQPENLCFALLWNLPLSWLLSCSSFPQVSAAGTKPVLAKEGIWAVPLRAAVLWEQAQPNSCSLLQRLQVITSTASNIM